MIRKEQGEFVAECDNCGDELAGGTIDTWQEWMDEMRKHRWKSVKEGDTWLHFCETCRETN